MAINVKANFIDKVVNYVNPIAAAKRLAGRASFNSLLTLGTPGRTGFNVPGKRNRSMVAWRTSNTSPDIDTLNALPGARAGSRDLFMNTPIAGGALRRIRAAVIGPGLKLRAAPDRSVLFKDNDDAADAWERNTEREFALWSETKDCDLTRQHDFKQMTALAFMSMMMNGDMCAVMPYKQVGDNPYKLKIKMIEGDQLCNPRGQPERPDFAGGIERDSDGTPVNYHFCKIHPGSVGFSIEQEEWITVPAFGEKTQRRNVIHLKYDERIGQPRGMPILANVLEKVKQVSRLSEAETDKALIQSLLTVFITTDAPEKGPLDDAMSKGDGSGEGKETTLDTVNHPEDSQQIELGKGTVTTLQPGEKIETVQSTSPSGQFAPFFNACVKEIGMNIGVPFELLMLHFDSSYTAYRGEILEAWRFFKDQRALVISDWNQIIYEEFLWEGVTNGRIVAPGFISDPALRKAWCGATWIGPPMGQTDPIKETQAAILRAQWNLSTYEDEIFTIDGSRFEDVVSGRARENKMMSEKGVMPPALIVKGMPQQAGPSVEVEADPETDGKGKKGEE